jgi:hypothetical protein
LENKSTSFINETNKNLDRHDFDVINSEKKTFLTGMMKTFIGFIGRNKKEAQEINEKHAKNEEIFFLNKNDQNLKKTNKRSKLRNIFKFFGF